MKTKKDPRHKTRVKTVKKLFSRTFYDEGQEESGEVKRIIEKTEEIDKKISKAAPDWPIDKLNKIDLAILRLALYELLYTKTPPKVVIDEAVEIAKEYGSENSPSFVNGVLGNIYSEL